MNRKQEMFIIAMEECGELIQACSKMIRSEGINMKKRLIVWYAAVIGAVGTVLHYGVTKGVWM